MSRKIKTARAVGQGMVKVVWENRDLLQGLNNGGEKVRQGLIAVMEYNAPKCETYMKINAPWTDQTSNARNGLQARPFQQGDDFGIVLFHTVPYGVWLELKYSGRYAIILPTIEAMGPQVMASCQRLLDGTEFV